jgi:hypothetical protein
VIFDFAIDGAYFMHFRAGFQAVNRFALDLLETAHPKSRLPLGHLSREPPLDRPAIDQACLFR